MLIPNESKEPSTTQKTPETTLPSYLLSHQCDATTGASGAPLFLCNNTNITLLGIHHGQLSKGQNYNAAAATHNPDFKNFYEVILEGKNPGSIFNNTEIPKINSKIGVTGFEFEHQLQLLKK